MRIEAPTWQGAQQAVPMFAQFAQTDRASGMGLKSAAWEHEFRQREELNQLLRAMAQKKAAEKAAKKKGSWGGMAGAGAGAVLGAVAAPFTGGMSLLASTALGAGVGGSVGGGIDEAMGNSGRSGQMIGSSLMDFSTEFLPTMDNPWMRAMQQQNVGGSYQVPFGGYPGQAVGLGS